MTEQFTEIVDLIKKGRARALKNVNAELINIYWQVGEYMTRKIEQSLWGEGTIRELAFHIQKHQPVLKGFELRNLYRMKQLYETYSCQLDKLIYLKDTDNQIKIVSSSMTQFTDIRNTILAEVSWTHHLLLMSKIKTNEERAFYLHLCICENYSVKELERQIKSSLYERVKLRECKIPASINKDDAGITTAFKDSYVFEFLNLPEKHSEKDLQKALVEKIKTFILELGNGFSFLAEEYRVTVGGTDFYIDLLFFHRDLQCLIAFELKTTEFIPEYLGKLNFYLEALDRKVKREHEKPSVGILLCKEQNSEVVEYALNRNLSPTVIAEYQTFLPDKKMLQEKLHELFENKNIKDADNE